MTRGIERDLRSHYGAQYRVPASDSPEGALDLLNQLKLRSDSVAPSCSQTSAWFGKRLAKPTDWLDGTHPADNDGFSFDAGPGGNISGSSERTRCRVT
jgi:hypothetical protein